MPSSVNPTLLLGSDASFDHVLSISSFVTSKQGSIPLSPSTLLPSPRMVSFDWNDLVDPRLPSSAPFQIRVVLRYIIDEGSFASILSSSAWQVLGSPKLVSATNELLDFEKSSAWEPWPLP
jgi:hypothetical protein